jgi:hypothetical protein
METVRPKPHFRRCKHPAFWAFLFRLWLLLLLPQDHLTIFLLFFISSSAPFAFWLSVLQLLPRSERFHHFRLFVHTLLKLVFSAPVTASSLQLQQIHLVPPMIGWVTKSFLLWQWIPPRGVLNLNHGDKTCPHPWWCICCLWAPSRWRWVWRAPSLFGCLFRSSSFLPW